MSGAQFVHPHVHSEYSCRWVHRTRLMAGAIALYREAGARRQADSRVRGLRLRGPPRTEQTEHSLKTAPAQEHALQRRRTSLRPYFVVPAATSPRHAPLSAPRLSISSLNRSRSPRTRRWNMVDAFHESRELLELRPLVVRRRDRHVDLDRLGDRPWRRAFNGAELFQPVEVDLGVILENAFDTPLWGARG